MRCDALSKTQKRESRGGCFDSRAGERRYKGKGFWTKVREGSTGLGGDWGGGKKNGAEGKIHKKKTEPGGERKSAREQTSPSDFRGQGKEKKSWGTWGRLKKKAH